MLEEDFEIALKVIVVGDGNVGKSSMIQRFCKGIYTTEYKKTIGVDFLEKQLRAGQEDVRLMVWDTAGQEEFDAITKAYYRGAQLCILVFSTVDRHSFEAVENWKNKVEVEVGEVHTALVQNKVDLIDEAVIKPEEAEELASKFKIKLFRTSVKDNFNVQEVFEHLVLRYLENIRQKKNSATPQPLNLIGSAVTISKNNEIKATSSSTANQPFSLKPSKQRAKKKKNCFL